MSTQVFDQGCWITGFQPGVSTNIQVTDPPPFQVFAHLQTDPGSCRGIAVFGTATVPHQGTSTFTLTQQGVSGSAVLTVTWNLTSPLSLPSQNFSQGTVGRPYSAQISATGASSNATYSLTGSLPAGLSLASNGAISGTPTAAGTANFSVTVDDPGHGSDSQSYSITINPVPSLGSMATVYRTLPSNFPSLAFNLSGGTSPFTWSAIGLPAGASINPSTGATSGLLSSSGSGSATITVTDANGATASTALNYEISPAIGGLGGPLPTASVGVPYSFQLTATGGRQPLTWSMAYGFTPPPGLSLSPQGLISGTPSAALSYGFFVRAEDANGSYGISSYQILIEAVVQVTTTSLAPATVGALVTAQLSAAAGNGGPYTFSITGGALPSGLSLAPNGSITGTPTTAGTANFTVQASDGVSNPGTANLQWLVNPPPSFPVTSLPPKTIGSSFNVSVSATGGTAPLSYSLHAGSLPGGVTLQGHTLNGTLSTIGTSQFTIRVTDANGVHADLPLAQVVNSAPSLGSFPVSSARVGQTAMGAVTASGGTGSLSISLASGSLPPGIGLSSNGNLSGTFSAAGTFPFTLMVTDADGIHSTQSYSVLVRPVVNVSPSGAVPPATANAPYSLSVGATNLQEPVTYSLGASVLPPGLTLNGNSISGIPTTPGSYSFGISAVGADGDTAFTGIDLLVNPQLQFIPPPAQQLVVGQAMTWRPTLQGGTPPLLVSLLGSTLPPGFTLNRETGVISGTPTQPGNFQFTIEATDANGARVQHFIQTTIREAIVVNLQLAPVYPLGQSLEANILANEGQAPYTFRIAQGNLPLGVQLSEARLLGTPAEAGSFPFTLEVSDAAGTTVRRAYRMLVADGFLLSTNALSFQAQPGERSTRQTIKFDSIPVGVPLEWTANASWLKLARNESVTPGAVDVWVDAVEEITMGSHEAFIEFRAPGLKAQQVSVKLLAYRAEDAGIEVARVSAEPGNHLVSLRAKLPELPFSARLEGPGAASYRLSNAAGKAGNSGATALLISPSEDRSRLGLETTLVIENGLTGELSRIEIPTAEVPPVVVSAQRIQMLTPTPRSLEVIVRSQSGPRRYATTVDAPWLKLLPDSGELKPTVALQVLVDPAGLLPGRNSAMVTLFLEDGRPAASFTVNVDNQSALANPRVETASLVFGSARREGQILLRNPAKDPVDFHIRGSVAALKVEESQGTLAPGEVRAVLVTASSFEERESFFVSFGNGDPAVVDSFWLAPAANCAAGAQIAWLSPARGNALRQGVSVAIDALLTDGCGNPLTSGALTILQADGSAAKLVSRGDGIWSGFWQANEAGVLELLYVSSDAKQQAQQRLTVEVRKD